MTEREPPALDVIFKRLHLANARRIWRDLVQRAEQEHLGYEAFLRALVEEEVAHRRGTRLRRKTRGAGFPFLKTVDEFDFSLQESLRATTIGSFLSHDFVTEGRSLILYGKPGRGKTHLAVAIAYRAIQNGFDALFVNAAALIDDISAASRDGTRKAVLAPYLKPHVLVVDEVGYLTHADDAANALFHVVHERHIRRRAMIFTTNKDPNDWGDVLHDDDLAAAIVDRILERGRLLRLDGPSGRTRHLPPEERPVDNLNRAVRFSGKQRSDFPEPTRGSRSTAVATRSPISVRPTAPTSTTSRCTNGFWSTETNSRSVARS
jgi:DNA replication protein DnaC